MKRPALIIFAALLLAVVVLGFVTTVKQVPDRHVDVRVGSGDAFMLYDPGYHFVPPFARAWAVYPVGGIERRFPLTETFEAITRDGATVGVALMFRLDFSRDSAGAVFEVR